jgi:type IV secretion system protein VirB2
MRIANMIKHKKQAFAIQPEYIDAMSAVEREQQSKQLVRFVLVSAVVFLVAFEPSLAMAEDAADDGLTNAATKILGLLTGNLGKAVATIAVVIMGMMAMFGKLEWERAFKVVLGIAIVFGAASIMKLFGGTTIGGVL